MRSREEFARAIDAFLFKMIFLTSVETGKSLDALPGFSEELAGVLESFRRPGAHPEDVLGTALGLVDEYVHARWEEVMEEAYALYTDMAGGRSRRHP